MIVKKVALIGLAGALTAVGIAAPSIAGGNKYASTSQSFTCESMLGETGTVTLVGPEKLWPPNHKFVDEPVTATSTDPSEQVTLTLVPEVDDAAGGDGGSNHDPDAQLVGGSEDFTASGTGSATAALQLRAERSGKGEGRIYTINWTAMFGSDECSSDDEGNSPFVITVPHDMRGGQDFK